jgi:phosphoglycolate phosphatase
MASDALAGCTIAFDLDGTLVDSAPDIHRALVAIMAQQALPAPSLADVHTFIGQGARATIVRAGAVHGVYYEEAELDRLTEQFTDIYASDIAALTRPWPGVEAALGELRAEGAVLCVCTNKRTHLSNRLLSALNLSHWFAAVIGADDVARKKPHPDHFIAAVRAAKGDPARALMVGDSAADVGSAHGANAPVALVSFGYTDTAPELLGADAVFSHFDELPGLTRKLLAPKNSGRPGY